MKKSANIYLTHVLLLAQVVKYCMQIEAYKYSGQLAVEMKWRF